MAMSKGTLIEINIMMIHWEKKEESLDKKGCELRINPLWTSSPSTHTYDISMYKILPTLRIIQIVK